MRTSWERATHVVIHALDEQTGLVHAVYSFRAGDVASVIADANRGKLQGMRRGCDKSLANMHWVPLEHVTCLDCAMELP